MKEIVKAAVFLNHDDDMTDAVLPLSLMTDWCAGIYGIGNAVRTTAGLQKGASSEKWCKPV